jgi:hypothetical protein
MFDILVEHSGLVGESRLARLAYLILVSRASDHPVSLILKGPSAAGKNFLVRNVLPFFPARAFWLRTSLSEHALIYNQESFVHRTLMLIEAAGLENEFVQYLTRALISEGRIVHETTEKTPQGLQARTIDKAGPTNFITTTTAVSLDHENETRFFSATINDTPEQTARILLEAATERDRGVDVRPWHALADWLDTEPWQVTIPYSEALAKRIPPIAVRLRRDFPAVQELIRAHAFLHQATRGRDADGRIIATLVDYSAIYALVADLVAEGLGAMVSKAIRETVDAVCAIGGEGVSVTNLAKHLKIDKAAASRRYRAAKATGYLRNLETRKGFQAKITLGDPLPEAVVILPEPGDLASEIAREGEGVDVLPGC